MMASSVLLLIIQSPLSCQWRLTAVPIFSRRSYQVLQMGRPMTMFPNWVLINSERYWKMLEKMTFNCNVMNVSRTWKCSCFSCLPSPFLVAQTVKKLPTTQGTWAQSQGQEDSMEEGMATHSSILAWEIPWTEEPGRLQSMGSQRVGHDWAPNTLTPPPLPSGNRHYDYIHCYLCF